MIIQALEANQNIASRFAKNQLLREFYRDDGNDTDDD
jgi:hypothetical protein